MKPTREEVLALFEYEPETGLFRWAIKKGMMKIGDIAGAPNGRGYIRLKFGERRYLAHVVVWFLMTGYWPANRIDHKDGDGENNRWENLRAATQAQNLANKAISTRNKSGYKGVCLDKRRGRFKAEIQKGELKLFLGYFETAKAAHDAYVAAAVIVHGEFARG